MIKLAQFFIRVRWTRYLLAQIFFTMFNCSDLWIKFLSNLAWIILPIVGIPLYPVNWLYEFFTIYHTNCCRAENTQELHSIKLQRIQEQVQKWNLNGRSKKMCSARKNSNKFTMRDMDKSKFHQIHVDAMDDIIEINLDKMILIVEPGVSMAKLTNQILRYGVTIPVIPEFDTLTVGGLVNGTGIETSSHKYGLFASTCIEYEVILADGTVATCSKEQNADIFYCLPMSHGTLGFLTSVTFPLIKAGKYVKLEYHVSKTIAETEELLRRSENEFVEGFLFEKNKAVVVHGNFTDVPERGMVNHINRWYKNWYYKHAYSFINKKDQVVEYVPTRDYYHRHTRSYFWMTTIPTISHSRIYIFLFGWLFPPNFNYTKSLTPKCKCLIDTFFKRTILQDLTVPLDTLAEGISLADVLTGVYPLWMCPYKTFKRPGLVRCRGETDTAYVDIGIWGLIYSEKLKRLGGSAVEAVKQYEQFVIQKTGLQFFYTDTYLSKTDFGRMFDRSLYDKIRKELNCQDAFPDVYEKVALAYKKN